MNRYIVLFAYFSLLGWLWESVYCTVKEQKWANRGFLFGPVCPIYGFGALVALALYDLIRLQVIPAFAWWQTFLVAFFVSMVLEYPTSWLLEQLFHARWWDYSHLPLNINGRTSVPSSAAFGVGGIVVMQWLIPTADVVLRHFPAYLTQALALIIVAVLSVDVTLTATVLSDFQKRVTALEDGFQTHMASIVQRLYDSKDTVQLEVLRRIAVLKLPPQKNKSLAKKKEKEQRFNKLMEEYRSSDVVMQMDQYLQHGNTTTLAHCENVAWISFLVNDKLKLNADEKLLVESAVMHDLYLYDWHDGRPERKTHGFTHSETACQNAVLHFDIPPKAQEIIRSHMWPLNITKIPKSREALILCLADKYCAMIETLRMNKHFGIR